jgi:hypothetical protein
MRRPWVILSLLWTLGLAWISHWQIEPQNPWRWETAIQHVPDSVLKLFVASSVTDRMPIEADGWENLYLPPDADQATVAEVKAALDNAMQIEIEAEKPWWYLGRFLCLVIPSMVFLLFELAANKIRSYIA